MPPSGPGSTPPRKRGGTRPHRRPKHCLEWKTLCARCISYMRPHRFAARSSALCLSGREYLSGPREQRYLPRDFSSRSPTVCLGFVIPFSKQDLLNDVQVLADHFVDHDLSFNPSNGPPLDFNPTLTSKQVVGWFQGTRRAPCGNGKSFGFWKP